MYELVGDMIAEINLNLTLTYTVSMQKKTHQ